jgi:hypothetical protein
VTNRLGFRLVVAIIHRAGYLCASVCAREAAWHPGYAHLIHRSAAGLTALIDTSVGMPVATQDDDYEGMPGLRVIRL